MAALLSRRWGLAAVLITTLALVAAPASSAKQVDGPLSFIENGTLRVGVDLTDGGKITYLSTVSGPHAQDLLQDVQQSYYGGTLDNPWHVAASGGTVLANRNDRRTIYTKVIPRIDYGKQCTCTFETWITLKGNTVHVRNRLIQNGSRELAFVAHGQELPALYTTGDAYRLFTYDGATPFVRAPVHEITDDRGGFFAPGPSFLATEHWAALVNDEGFGIGLFEPGLTRFSGTPGNEYAINYGWVNGYVAASTTETLDSSPAYTYGYTLIVGSLEEIRNYAVDHAPQSRPNYQFRTNRQHWWELNATDSASPVRGALRLFPDHLDPQIYGPETSFAAEDVPSLYVRGAWHTDQNNPQLFWATATNWFDGDHQTTFRVITDGLFHTYRIPLAGVSGWKGTIRDLRLDLVTDNAEPGHWVDISCISWKPCPVETRNERRLNRLTPSRMFLDPFDSEINPGFWRTEAVSEGTALFSAQGKLFAELYPGAQVGTGIDSACKLYGNYDVSVDYKLLEWPPANGVSVQLETDDGQAVGRDNGPGESYFAAAAGRRATATTDLAGSLRLVRRGGIERAYYRHSGEWVLISPSITTRAQVQVRLTVRRTGTSPLQQEVSVSFDNFRVGRGGLSCS